MLKGSGYMGDVLENCPLNCFCNDLLEAESHDRHWQRYCRKTEWQRERDRMRQMWSMDKAKKFKAHGKLIFCVYFVMLRFKPPGNKARLACECWVESDTIQGQGCPSDVKEGLSPALYFYGSLGLLKWLYYDQWKNGKLDKGKLMFDILTHLCLRLCLK